VKTFASISNILVIGHADSAGERPENGIANHSYCASHSVGRIELQIYPLKGNSCMDTTTKTALVIAFVVAALLFFGGGMGTGTMVGGGTMFSGGMIGSGINWMWLPTLLVVVLGVVLFSVIFGKKQGQQ
jgi:hypothetical protein